MGIRGTALGVVLIAALLGMPGAASAEEFAAIDAHNEGPGPVVWGSDKEPTRAHAVAACRRESNGCSGTAACTNNFSYVFAYMCCTRPRLGYTVGTGANKEEAGILAIKIGTDGGLTACRVRRYISAKTGKRM